MKRIALVNQRYGLEVNGGSEYYTRLLAEKLTDKYQVEVLTTCAKDYDTWKNVYNEGNELVNGVMVRRFKTVQNRKKLSQKISGKLLTLFNLEGKAVNNWWIKSQGPCVPELVKYIQENVNYYDAFIFVTYLYYTTAIGMNEVAEKSIFVPTAHDEFCINFPIYRELFFIPKALVYLTQEEKNMVWNKFHNEMKRYEVAGVGIDVPKQRTENLFRKKYGIDNEIFVYVGRVDENKGCGEMIKYFLSFINHIQKKYKKEKLPHLVIIGQVFMKIPTSEYIHCLGFVSDEDKYNAMEAAKMLWLPSEFESLSLSVLEAMATGTPVMVNGKCEVLYGHCEHSGGGMYYYNELECHNIMEKFICNKNIEEYQKMCVCAQKYIEDNYSWHAVIQKFEKLIEE